MGFFSRQVAIPARRINLWWSTETWMLGALTCVVIAVGMLVTNSAALADGPCGGDFDGPHACPLNTPYNVSGSLTTDNESDYFVFYATRGTELSATITNTSTPLPDCGYDISCGRLDAVLADSTGEQIDRSGQSYPHNGVDVPQNFSTTIGATGTYYIYVEGQLGYDNHGSPTPVPYTLNVTATPAVVWPYVPPTPPYADAPYASPSDARKPVSAAQSRDRLPQTWRGHPRHDGSHDGGTHLHLRILLERKKLCDRP